MTILTLFFAMLVSQSAPSQKQKPPESATSQNYSATKQNGSERVASPVKAEQAGQADAKPDYGQPTTDSEYILPVVAIIVSIFQFIALVWTVWVMIRNGHRQLRAYVLPDRGSLLDGSILNPPQNAKRNVPGGVLVLKNYGATPAYDVVAWVQMEVRHTTDQNALPPIPQLADKFSLVLGPQGVFFKSIWYNRTLSVNEIADIASGARAIFLYGRVGYRDAFKKTHFTDFRLFYTFSGYPPPAPEGHFTFTEAGNKAD